MGQLTPDDERRLAALPADAATATRMALERSWLKPGELKPLLERAERSGLQVARGQWIPSSAFDLARTLVDGWWDEIPPADALTAAQRAFMEIVACHPELKVNGFPLANFARWSMCRWLGLDPGGALEQPASLAGEGGSGERPLWQSLARRRQDPEGLRILLEALPMSQRLEVFGELDAGGYGFIQVPFPGVDSLRDEGRAWAPRHADWLLGLGKDVYDPARHPEMQTLLALAWARSQTTIERRWEVLLPVRLEDTATLREWFQALPDDRRAPVLGKMLKVLLWNHVFPARPSGTDAATVLEPLLPLFEKHPPSGVLDDAMMGYTAGYHAPRRPLLATVAALAKRFPVLAPALRLDPTKKPPKLTAAPVPLPPPEKLTAFDKDQIRKIGDGTYDHLEAFDLTDANSDRRYRAVVHAGCDGYVVASGTEDVVAIIAQHSADGEDGVLCAAIDKALRASLTKPKKKR